ncbi:MAG: DNA primase [Chromatiales bacterium]|nr:DNA primase [Chromatiales bacterium]
MAGRIPAQFIDELLNRVDIVDLINSRVPLKKAGKEYQACCPFHDEKTPSFTVSRQKQFYHCFGCGAHGTAIGFLMEYENAGFIDAVEELAASQGLEVPREGRDQQGPDYRPLYELLDNSARFYQWQLRKHPDSARAVNYLKKRGLSGEIAAEYGIGFAPRGWRNLIEQFGRNAEELKKLNTCGMTSNRDEGGEPYDRFRDRIMFPIRNHRGHTIGFGGRILGDGKPKYLNSPETPIFHKGQELYGLFEARKSLRNINRLMVVEGYMDVVALAQFNIRYAVATLGTATTAEHLQHIFRTTQEVIFCFDGDRAGRDAGWKALETALPLMKDGREARFLFLPDDEDPDTLIRKIGTEAFEERITNATPLSSFLFTKLEEEVNKETPEGLAQLAEQAKPLLQKLPNGLLRKMMFQKLEQIVGVDLTEPPPPAQTPSKRRPPPTERKFLGTMPPIRRAVALLLTHPEFAQLSDLPNHWRQLSLPGISLLKELLEILRMQPNLKPAALLERWRGREEEKHLKRLSAQMFPIQQEGLATEFIATLKSLDIRQDELEMEQLLEKAQSKGLSSDEKQRLSELLSKKAHAPSAGRAVDDE